MANVWKLKRVEQQQPGAVELVCDTGYYPATVTLENQDGGLFVTTACFPLDDPNPCSFFAAFSVPDGAGDWAGACS
jgi:hypothetical protein